MGDLLSSFVRDDRSDASTAWLPHLTGNGVEWAG